MRFHRRYLYYSPRRFGPMSGPSGTCAQINQETLGCASGGTSPCDLASMAVERGDESRTPGGAIVTSRQAAGGVELRFLEPFLPSRAVDDEGWGRSTSQAPRAGFTS